MVHLLVIGLQLSFQNVKEKAAWFGDVVMFFCQLNTFSGLLSVSFRKHNFVFKRC